MFGEICVAGQAQQQLDPVMVSVMLEGNGKSRLGTDWDHWVRKLTLNPVQFSYTRGGEDGSDF